MRNAGRSAGHPAAHDRSEAKVCGAVAVAARCHALGIDPDAMVATEDETAEAVGRLLRGVAEDGVPIMVVVDQEEGTGS